MFFFFNDTATTEIYTLSLHDALPISAHVGERLGVDDPARQAAIDGRARAGRRRLHHRLAADDGRERLPDRPGDDARPGTPRSKSGSLGACRNGLRSSAGSAGAIESWGWFGGGPRGRSPSVRGSLRCTRPTRPPAPAAEAAGTPRRTPGARGGACRDS